MSLDHYQTDCNLFLSVRIPPGCLIPTVSKELRVDNPGSDTWSGVLPSLLQPGEKHELDLLFLCLYELVIL
jgi:hypothetical protein